MCGCLAYILPNGGPNPQPWLEMEPATFCFVERRSTNWAILVRASEWIFLRKWLDFVMLMEVGIPYCISILNIHGKLRTTFFLSCKVFIALVLCSFCSIFSGYFKSHSTDRMKKFKRRLSLTLRGSQTIDESLSELAEQMTIEENSSKDNGKYLGVGRGGKILYTFDYCVNGMKIYFPD